MSGFENWPAPILRRWLLSAAAGPVIFLIGLAGRIALHDPTLLTLSTLLASCMVIRCILLFRVIRQVDYETVEGVCVAIRRAPLGGYQHIRLMDDSGTAHTSCWTGAKNFWSAAATASIFKALPEPCCRE